MTRCAVISDRSTWFFTRKNRLAIAGWAVSIAWGAAQLPAANIDPQLVAKGLERTPKQSDAQYDKVEKAEIPNCTGRYESRNGVQGLLILSANNQPLRWLADTNADKSIDQFCFYKDGIESYRDMDTDFDNKVDQSRWLGNSGMRWGIDRDQDGTLDQWKVISPEETSYEVVEALRTNDVKRFERLLISEDQIKSIGIGPNKASELSKRIESSVEGFKALIKSSKGLGEKSRWASFGADKPGIVPSGTDESTKDIVAYENAMAAIDNGSSGQPQQLMIGTLIKVEDTWKLVDAPRFATDGANVSESGIFFASTTTSRNSEGGVALSASMEKLVQEMSAVEAKLAQAKADEKPRLHAQKADLLQQLIDSSTTLDDAQSWTRQLADQVLSAAQAGEYPDGLDRLIKLQTSIRSIPGAKSEVPYVAYRILTAEYNLAMSEKDVNYEKLQKTHLDKLEAFVNEYPESMDSADAMIQLGLNSELTNDLKAAEKWYELVEKRFPKTPQGEQASGALLRLNLKGRQIDFAGTTLEGKQFSSAKLKRPVIVHYWASWCVPCKADMQELKKLQAKYAKSGLTIVGVNADNDSASAIQFLKENKNIDWVQLHEKGGLQSRLAVGLGVFSLPVTIIIDSKGVVVEASSHYTPNMEVAIQDMLK
jgi:thiol-disulfide isomerase/thioredoxin